MCTRNLVTRKIAGETVIVPVKSGVGDLNCIYTLNQTGTAVWDMREAGASIQEIAARLCEQYEVGKEQASNDVAEFFESLRSAGLWGFAENQGGIAGVR
jgi:hypothetical protein